MPNPYFSSNYFAVDKDQKLAESLITEMIYNHGIAIKYLPRELVNYDQIYGEDQSSMFDTFYNVDVYVKNVNGFQGDGNFLAKFGIEIRDEMTFSISRTHFKTSVLDHEPTMSRPREGDLIAVPSIVDKRKRLFEITYVNQEENFYQFGSLYTWEVRCKTFELAGEQFNTGDTDIDSVELSKLFLELKMGTGNAIAYTVGEQVSVSNTTIKAYVKSWDNVNHKLVLERMDGEFLPSYVLAGVTSGALWSVESIVDATASTITYSDTEAIKKEGSAFILFDETNPFSEF